MSTDLTSRFSVHGSVAVIVGGGSGIGRASALALAEAGADVVVADIAQQRGADVVGQVRVLGRRAIYLPVDVRITPSVDSMAVRVQEEFGRIDILVNAAGIDQPPSPVLEYADDKWNAFIDVNLTGVLRTCRAVGRVMVENRRGSVVNIASIAGHRANRGFRGTAGYSVSKAGVVGLTRILADEWAQFNVRVNSVSPGYVLTPMTQKAYDDPAIRRSMVTQTPMGRVAHPDEIASAVVYLASPASSFVTGHDCAVDGGYLVW